MITCLISYDDAYFLVKNKGGLLDGLYGFVQYEVESPRSFEEEFYKQYQHSIEVVEYIKDVKHVFSHRTWNMSVYKARFLNQPALPLNSLMQLEALPMATAHKKLLKLI